MTTAEDWSQMTREPAPAGGFGARNGDAAWATLGYLGAILLSPIFLGPVIPLAAWLSRRDKTPFLRYHAARALNMSMSGLLYAICCGILGAMLALDTVGVALIVALPLLSLLWLVQLRYLIRGALAAQRGEPYELPAWICATFVSS